MPFGKKTLGNGGYEIDFDLIYDSLIREAGERLKYKMIRSVTDQNGGLITPNIIRWCYEADLVIADVTYHNPNVFYELGIRHALRGHGTVLLRRSGGNLGYRKLKLFGQPRSDDPPFDIRDISIWSYDLSTDNVENQIEELIKKIFTAKRTTHTDSPVFDNITGLRITTSSQKAPRGQKRDYEIADAPGRFVGYRSGDIGDLKGADAVDYWVNSENTLMQMARMYENSVSSKIRYLGAKDPDLQSPTFDDTIADALKRRLGNRHMVEEGEILITESGRLAETHAVKAILHAAAVTGRAGRGWQSISDEQLVDLVCNVINAAREENWKRDAASAGRSLIMPIFGAGQGQSDASLIAGQMIEAAIETLATPPPPEFVDRDITHVLFTAYRKDELLLLERLFAAFVGDKALKPIIYI